MIIIIITSIAVSFCAYQILSLIMVSIRSISISRTRHWNRIADEWEPINDNRDVIFHSNQAVFTAQFNMLPNFFPKCRIIITGYSEGNWKNNKTISREFKFLYLSPTKSKIDLLVKEIIEEAKSENLTLISNKIELRALMEQYAIEIEKDLMGE